MAASKIGISEMLSQQKKKKQRTINLTFGQVLSKKTVSWQPLALI